MWGERTKVHLHPHNVMMSAIHSFLQCCLVRTLLCAVRCATGRPNLYLFVVSHVPNVPCRVACVQLALSWQGVAMRHGTTLPLRPTQPLCAPCVPMCGMLLRVGLSRVSTHTFPVVSHEIPRA